MSVDLLNRMLRPGSVAALIVVGVFFLTGLATIMLFRYAVHGEIDWQGLAAFCTMVLIPLLQHAQNRHDLYKSGRINADRPFAPSPSAEPSPSGGLVNNQAIS